jgi:hypothetical protein
LSTCNDKVGAISFLGAIRKRSDLTFTQFAEHWLRTHRALMLPLADEGYLTGYIQNLRIDPPMQGLEADLDGAPELSIRDSAAFAAMTRHKNFVEALDVHTPRFVEMPPAASLVSRTVVTERMVAPVAAVKLMLFVHAVDDGHDRLQRAWHESSAPIVMPQSRPLRLVRMTAQPQPPARVPYFGCESSWWKDLDALAEAWSRRSRPEQTRALGIASVWVLPAREHIAIEAARPHTEIVLHLPTSQR